MHAVADEFHHDIGALDYCAGQARFAMVQRRHPVEEMRGLRGARSNGGHRLCVGRAGVPERDTDAERPQPGDEFQCAVDLRRERHDADVSGMALDDRGQVGGGERAGADRPSTSRRRRTGPGAQAGAWLRAGVFRADEVAFEVRGHDTRAERRRCAAQLLHLIEHAGQIERTAGHGGGCKRGDAEAWQRCGHALDRMRIVMDVDTGDAVHVEIDEAGNDGVTVEGRARCRRRQRPLGANIGDAAISQHQGAGPEHAIGQDEVGAREDDH